MFPITLILIFLTLFWELCRSTMLDQMRIAISHLLRLQMKILC